MKKTWVALFLSVFLWIIPIFPDELPITGRLFVEQKWEYTYHVDPPWWDFYHDPWWDVREEKWQLAGSVWAAQTSDKPIFVTAAHALGVNLEPPQQLGGHHIDGKTAFLMNVRGTVLIGTLAYEPFTIGLLKDANDAAFLTVNDLSAFKAVRLLSLSDSPPIYGESVQVCGYPKTSDQQFATAVVTSVHEDAGFFVLNEALDEGYSGGVVLNSAGKAYGVIVNTDLAKKQTKVLRVTPDTLKTIDWHPADKVLNKIFP
jgi:hypothetical protein